MTLVVPQVGELIFLKAGLNNTAGQDQTLKLFATNITPSETDTAATYTVAAGGGYADKSLLGASWSFTSATPSFASYAQQTWTFTGPLTTNTTVYGYYVVQVTSGTLIWAEAFSSFTPANNGDQILLTPKITAD